MLTVEDGTPPHPARLSSELVKAQRGVQVPTLRFHDLRHTSATLDLLAGIHAKVVAEKLGHSSIAMTLDVYSSYLPSMGEDAAARREQVLYGAAAR